MRSAVLVIGAGLMGLCPLPNAQGLPQVDKPLAISADALRGEQLGRSREGTCVMCHQIETNGPGGSIAPPLAGTGIRYNAAQLRARLIDAQAVTPGTLMPSYFRVDHLVNVDPRFKQQTVFSAQQIEDLIAWLVTLR
jgi:L-cysteine S-thiosulfotransferase